MRRLVRLIGPRKRRAARLILFDLEIYSRLLTMGALNLVLNGLSFVERRQSGTFDGTDVYEHIFAAALRLNEPIALRWIEPFHGAGSHAGLLAESNNNSVVRLVGNSKLPPWLAAKGMVPLHPSDNRHCASSAENSYENRVAAIQR